MATKDKAQDERPLDKKRLKFIDWFRKYRDLYKAAERAGIPKAKAVAVFHEPAVQDEIERQDEAVRMERARQEVQAERLTNEEIDRELLSVIRLSPRDHGSLKLDAIRLGAVMTGRIKAGNLQPIEQQPAPETQPGGFSYHAVVQVGEARPYMPPEPAPAPNTGLPAAAAAVAAPAVIPPPPPTPQRPADAKPGAARPAAGRPAVTRIG